MEHLSVEKAVSPLCFNGANAKYIRKTNNLPGDGLSLITCDLPPCEGHPGVHHQGIVQSSDCSNGGSINITYHQLLIINFHHDQESIVIDQ